MIGGSSNLFQVGWQFGNNIETVTVAALATLLVAIPVAVGLYSRWEQRRASQPG